MPVKSLETLVLDPRNFGYKETDQPVAWRMFLKNALLTRRNWLSDYSGIRLNTFTGCEMHEGIVTRRDVMGTKWKILIFHEYNCFLLTPEEHRQHGHKREWALQKAYSIYGRDNVVEWFESLPFRVRPFKLL